MKISLKNRRINTNTTFDIDSNDQEVNTNQI